MRRTSTGLRSKISKELRETTGFSIQILAAILDYVLVWLLVIVPIRVLVVVPGESRRTVPGYLPPQILPNILHSFLLSSYLFLFNFNTIEDFHFLISPLLCFNIMTFRGTLHCHIINTIM